MNKNSYLYIWFVNMTQNKIISNVFSFPSSIISFLLVITNKPHPSTSEASWKPYSVKTACVYACICSFENATKKVPKSLIGLCKTCIRQKTSNVRVITIHWAITLRNIHVSSANYPTTRHSIAEDLNLLQHPCENLSRVTLMLTLLDIQVTVMYGIKNIPLI